MSEENVSVVFRIEKNLKTAFENVAREKDETVSQMLRKYIRWEVEENAKKNAQRDLFKAQGGARKPERTPEPKKGKKPPMESREGLLAMFKTKR